MKNRSLARQSGFTLVEIAIVLVIVGLLLGGVLKGQELIENSRIKRFASDMKSIQVAYHGYLDRYQAVPGDEAAATLTARGFAGTVGATGTAGDGVLVIPIAATFTNAATSDQPAFLRSLRGSGLMTGDPAAIGAAALPSNGVDGLVGVTAGPAYGLAGPLVCVSGLTTKQVAGLDVLIDGPGATATTGSLRAATGAAPLAPVATAALAASAPYNETTITTRWTACMPI